MRLLGLFLALALISSSCGGDDLSPEDFFESAFGIEAAGCSLVPRLGSGIAVAPNVIMTSAHTVAGATAITVHDSSGSAISADLLAIDPDLDLAVLGVRTREPLSPLDTREAIIDEPAWLVAWDPESGVFARELRVVKRLVVTIEDIYIQDIVERRAIELLGDIGPGDSGGAVVARDGSLVGVVYGASRSRDAGFAVRSVELERVLTTARAEPVEPGRCVP